MRPNIRLPGQMLAFCLLGISQTALALPMVPTLDSDGSYHYLLTGNAFSVRSPGSLVLGGHDPGHHGINTIDYANGQFRVGGFFDLNSVDSVTYLTDYGDTLSAMTTSDTWPSISLKAGADLTVLSNITLPGGALDLASSGDMNISSHLSVATGGTIDIIAGSKLSAPLIGGGAVRTGGNLQIGNNDSVRFSQDGGSISLITHSGPGLIGGVISVQSVPEPGTGLLMSLGCAALVGVRAGKRRNAT